MTKASVDITDLQFNNLIAIRLHSYDKRGSQLWLFNCLLCNKDKVLRKSYVVSGKKKNCGCKHGLSGKYEDLTNQKFGKLLLLKQVGLINKSMSYLARCDCGIEKVINGSEVKNGWRKTCGCGRKGSGHYNYNANLTEYERKVKRHIPGKQAFLDGVRRRDYHTCQTCGRKGQPGDYRFAVHHIESWAKNKDLRTDINNGILLCKKCHDEFHNKYGSITNKAQFEKFMSDKKEENKDKRPKSIFIDIDGVILKYKGKPTDRLLLESEILPGVKEKFDEWDMKGYNIYIVTGRRKSMKKQTIKQLKKFGLFWTDIIFNCGGGVRMIINDRKPATPNEDTAIAVNLPRNKGLEGVHV